MNEAVEITEYEDAPADNPTEEVEAPEVEAQGEQEGEQPEAKETEEKSFGENAAEWAEAVSKDDRFADNEFKDMKPFDPIQQKFIEQKMFARERGKRGELEQKLAYYERMEAEGQLQSQSTGRPPDMDPPELFEDNYEAKMQAWRDNVQAQAQWDIQEQQRQQQQQEQQQREYYENQRVLAQKVTAYQDRAEKAGIDAEELDAIGRTINTVGINPTLEMAILEHEQGPLMSRYLASNPPLAAHLRDMDPVLAGMQLGQALNSLKAQQTRKKSPPPPPEIPEGKGAPEKRRGPEGAKYR